MTDKGGKHVNIRKEKHAILMERAIAYAKKKNWPTTSLPAYLWEASEFLEGNVESDHE